MPSAAERPHLYSLELRTSRWPEMVAWYRSVLAARVLLRVTDDRFALVDLGGVKLALVGRDEAAPASPRWSLAFEVADLDAMCQQLDAAGAEHSAIALSGEGYRELTLADPDGNQLRIFAWPSDVGV